MRYKEIEDLTNKKVLLCLFFETEIETEFIFVVQTDVFGQLLRQAKSVLKLYLKL